jgi:hypothetical protein
LSGGSVIAIRVVLARVFHGAGAPKGPMSKINDGRRAMTGIVALEFEPLR